MLGLSVLALSATAMIAVATSAASAIAVRMGAARLAEMEPTARARLMLIASVLPLLVAVGVMAAAFAPSFGWVLDHCGDGARFLDPHAHPHLCAEHPGSGLPPWTLVVIAGLFAGRLGWFALAAAYRSVQGLEAAQALRRASSAAPEVHPKARVLPLPEPHAFVFGTFVPAMYVSESLLKGPAAEHLAAVVAHEAAHIRRNDALWRSVAALAAAFHLPFVSRRRQADLVLAQEMVADRDAAVCVRSAESVASAIVALSRLRLSTPAAAIAFGGASAETRVRALLSDTVPARGPSKRRVACVAASFVVVLGAAAGSVHHAVEHVLGFFAG